LAFRAGSRNPTGIDPDQHPQSTETMPTTSARRRTGVKDDAVALAYRAAWTKDSKRRKASREAAIANLHAANSAQQTIDQPARIFDAVGVVLVSACRPDCRAARSGHRAFTPAPANSRRSSLPAKALRVSRPTAGRA
jgi:hypothetical protein